MKVFADNSLVWEGSVGPDVLGFDGPVGIRSDNARLQINLRTGQPLKAQPGHAPDCRSGERNPNNEHVSANRPLFGLRDLLPRLSTSGGGHRCGV